MSCQKNRDEAIPDNLINGLIKDKAAYLVDKLDVPTDIEKSVRNINNHFSGFIYVLDASCSICIAKFCGFCEQVKQEQVKFPIIVFVDEEYLPMVEYYTNRIENTPKQIVVIVDKHKHINRDMEPDFVFFLENMNVLRCFYYNPDIGN